MRIQVTETPFNMKPIIKKAYKVVQTLKNKRTLKMLSVNPNPGALYISDDGKIHGSDRVVEYKFGKATFPLDGDDVIFVCSSLKEAHKAYEFYMDVAGNSTIRVLSGFAGNPVEFKPRVGLYDEIFHRDKCYIVPTHFNTTLCDWFLPISYVTSNLSTTPTLKG